MDIRNRNLAEIARADDFIVSNQVINLLLTQISENKQLRAVFSDLLAPEGSEIYLKCIIPTHVGPTMPWHTGPSAVGGDCHTKNAPCLRSDARPKPAHQMTARSIRCCGDRRSVQLYNLNAAARTWSPRSAGADAPPG
jgi:hypothetical protein